MPEVAYIETYRSGLLEEKARAAREMLRSCRLCPRRCEVDRTSGSDGVCRTGMQAIVSSCGPHFGEEDCLRGRRGSGTIFFSMCNLGCVFCQNWDISHDGEGTPVSPTEIAQLMMSLQIRGCHNINLVTPSHVVPQILEALLEAIPLGLTAPIVYNSGGYDAMETLHLMEGVVDIYMPDFKFWSERSADRYAGAPDYPEVARRAILEMHRQVGPLDLDSSGVARRGVLIRHLVMPGLLGESRAIFHYLASEVSPETYVNIMDQYRPAGQSRRFPELSRRITREEYAAAVEAAREAGLHRFDERFLLF